MIDGKNTSAMLPRSIKKSLNNGIVVPAKTRGCKQCKCELFCVKCSIQKTENKEFEAKSTLIERQAPNEFG